MDESYRHTDNTKMLVIGKETFNWLDKV